MLQLKRQKKCNNQADQGFNFQILIDKIDDPPILVTEQSETEYFEKVELSYNSLPVKK